MCLLGKADIRLGGDLLNEAGTAPEVMLDEPYSRRIVCRSSSLIGQTKAQPTVQSPFRSALA
jgi:hypothetical protein